jgi:hypothetical protein
VQGISTHLSWDTTVVRPTAIMPGALLNACGGIALSPRRGTFDGAVLGVRAQGLKGQGELGAVTFEVLRAGDPRIAIASADGRDASNHRAPIVIEQTATIAVLPSVTSLSRAMPNPFSSSTLFDLAVANAGPVELSIFDLNGRRVRTLVRDSRPAGFYHVRWDGLADHGTAVPAGIYFVRFTSHGAALTQRIVRVR